MKKDANEIRSLTSRLERTGDYRRLASTEADRTTAEVAEMLAEVLELSDVEADELWTRDSVSFTDLTREEHEECAQRATSDQREARRPEVSRKASN